MGCLGLTRRLAALVAAALLLTACGPVQPVGDGNAIEGDALPNQGRADLETPDLGSTIAAEVPNPQPEQCDHTPPADFDDPTLVEVLEGAGGYSTLVGLIERSGLAEALADEGEGPFTLFAPTDEAFAAVPPDVLQIYRDNPQELDDLLRNHVVAGRCTADDLRQIDAASSLADRDIDLAEADSELVANSAVVVQPGIEAGNGIAHGIDSVLLIPPTDGRPREG